MEVLGLGAGAGAGLSVRFLGLIYSTTLRCESPSSKHRKKHLCHSDKNYYYFCKLNIPVINLIIGYINRVKVLKNMNL